MKNLNDYLMRPLRLAPDNFTFNMWGGSWIPRLKGLPASAQPVGESWEFSGHPAHPSSVLIDDETHSLNDLLKSHASEILGSAASRFNGRAPFLLKLIDPREDLSVQVHPDDEFAKKNEKDNGKAEAWVVLETGGPDACIYLGFSAEKMTGYATADQFEEAFLSAISEANAKGPSQDPKVRSAAERLVLPFLNKIIVKAGDVFDVPPGAIHAIGRGVRLFEIQQTSDLTYRVWDWNRPDNAKLKEGKMEFRPLHLDRAKKVIHAKGNQEWKVEPRAVFRDASGVVREDVLIKERDGRFASNKISLQKSGSRYQSDLKGSFVVLTVVKGRVEVANLGEVKAGHSVLIPAAAKSFEISALEASVEVLKSYLP